MNKYGKPADGGECCGLWEPPSTSEITARLFDEAVNSVGFILNYFTNGK